MNAKIRRWKFEEKQYLQSQIYPSIYFLIIKRKLLTLWWRNLTHTGSTQLSKLLLPLIKHTDVVFTVTNLKRHSMVLLPKMCNLSLILRNHQRSPVGRQYTKWLTSPLQNSQGHEKTRRDWRTVTHWKRLICNIGFWNRKRTMLGKLV